jgi:hypothetical protein
LPRVLVINAVSTGTEEGDAGAVVVIDKAVRNAGAIPVYDPELDAEALSCKQPACAMQLATAADAEFTMRAEASFERSGYLTAVEVYGGPEFQRLAARQDSCRFCGAREVHKALDELIVANLDQALVRAAHNERTVTPDTASVESGEQTPRDGSAISTLASDGNEIPRTRTWIALAGAGISAAALTAGIVSASRHGEGRDCGTAMSGETFCYSELDTSAQTITLFSIAGAFAAGTVVYWLWSSPSQTVTIAPTVVSDETQTSFHLGASAAGSF